MPIYFAGQEYNAAYAGGEEFEGARFGGESYHEAAVPIYEMSRTLDRTFGITPASGGGNVPPQTFVHEGNTWQVWQAIPFLGQGVVSGNRIGDARVHLRNRGVNRGSMQLADMPAHVVMESPAWDGFPWYFTRPTANNKFTNAGSGNNARKSIDYEPVRMHGASPAAEGVVQGQEFVLRLIFGDLPAQLLVPDGFLALSSTATTASLLWNRVPGAATYDVRWKVEGASGGHQLVRDIARTGSQVRYNLPGLTIATNYEVGVRANAPRRTPSDWTDDVEIMTTPTTPTKLPTPRLPRGSLGTVTGDDIAITFSTVPNAASYEVRVQDLSRTLETVSGRGPPLTVNLRPTVRPIFFGVRALPSPGTTWRPSDWDSIRLRG